MTGSQRKLFFFQAEDGIRDSSVTGVKTCALPMWDQGADPQLGVELAVQAPGKRELLVVGEGLVPEHEDGVLVHSRPDLAQGLGIVDPAEIDRARLGREARVKLPKCQGHWAPS